MARGQHHSRRWHLPFFLMVATIGCAPLAKDEEAASTGCDGSATTGAWVRKGGDETIAFTDGCKFTSSVCKGSATTSRAADAKGKLTLTRWKISEKGCDKNQPDRKCNYEINGDTLSLKCTPSGGGTYVRKAQ